MPNSTHDPDQTFTIDGLTAPVRIFIDDFGVPHIYAESQSDVFLAQGFNAARERLFQLDLWRRRGLGQLAAAFGPDYADRDRAARLFLYRGDMHAEWLAYGSDTKRVATAFVTGINAFIRVAEDQPALIPVEFGLLGYSPAYWDPADIAVIRSHGLFYNLEQEVARALTLRDFGPEVEDLRRVREPKHELTVPPGLDLSVIPADVLEVYRLATTQPVLGSATGEPAPRRTEPEGSNNWVVGATRTDTGRPILANDPHRAVGLPSLRYLAHLSAPGLDVIGAGEPALPGISIGHNGKIAFGLTIFSIDQEDLYVYQTNPDDPNLYLYADRWEPMTVVRETIAVCGGDDSEVELRFTRHGPVIYADAERHTAFAVRAAWLQPGMAPYLGSMDYMRAGSCEEFVSAMNRWGAPGENQVYAAPDGTIGWRPAGLVPIRPNWDGTLPVPGDGRYEWAGFYDVDQLPAEERPERDWVATANEMNLPVDYPNDTQTVSYDWYHRYRKDRLAEVLQTATGMTVEDCVRLQTDYVNVPARHVLKAIEDVTSADSVVQHALELLKGWDANETADSAAAALYEVWFRAHLRPALLRHELATLLPPEHVEPALARVQPDELLSADVRTDLRLLADLKAADATAASARPSTLSTLIETSLRSAAMELTALLGPDWSRWRWGQLHHAAPVHPASGLLDQDAQPWQRLERLPRGGSGDTVGSTAYDAPFCQTAGATFRIVVDVGDWDRSVAMNSPGQSGRPEDTHYSDLYQHWAADGSFPLHYSRAAVEAHSAERITLIPADE